ncbi:hypothetical protein ABIB26_003567 [Arthrobacter sp. UYEF20]
MDIADLLLKAVPGRVVTHVEELGQYRLACNPRHICRTLLDQ